MHDEFAKAFTSVIVHQFARYMRGNVLQERLRTKRWPNINTPISKLAILTSSSGKMREEPQQGTMNAYHVHIFTATAQF